MSKTIHAGDHTTDCDTCKANCDCGTCEQNARIRENMASNLDDAVMTSDFARFDEIFEDRDPFEFL